VASFRFLAENPFGLLLSSRARRPGPLSIRDIVLGLLLPKLPPEATAPPQPICRVLCCVSSFARFLFTGAAVCDLSPEEIAPPLGLVCCSRSLLSSRAPPPELIESWLPCSLLCSRWVPRRLRFVLGFRQLPTAGAPCEACLSRRARRTAVESRSSRKHATVFLSLINFAHRFPRRRCCLDFHWSGSSPRNKRRPVFGSTETSVTSLGRRAPLCRRPRSIVSPRSRFLRPRVRRLRVGSLRFLRGALKCVSSPRFSKFSSRNLQPCRVSVDKRINPFLAESFCRLAPRTCIGSAAQALFYWLSDLFDG
jgi:hypothetical protein